MRDRLRASLESLYVHGFSDATQDKGVCAHILSACTRFAREHPGPLTAVARMDRRAGKGRESLTPSPARQGMTEDELDRLEEFLAAVGPRAMSLGSMDGFFAALISGPEIILPSEYVPHIEGEAPASASTDEATQIADLILRHQDSMAATLQATLQSPGVYMPVLGVAEDSTTPARFTASKSVAPPRIPRAWRTAPQG